jgi:hypothetical protein
VNQKETFDWLVERSKELDAAVIKAADAFGIEAPDKDDYRWWVQAEPGPIECDSFAEALTERAALSEREIASLRSTIEAMRPVVEAAKRLIGDCYEEGDDEFLLPPTQSSVVALRAALASLPPQEGNNNDV